MGRRGRCCWRGCAGGTSLAGRQLGAQGGSQRWHLAREHIRAVGRRLVGFRKQPAVPEGLPRHQLGGPRRCHGVSLPGWPLSRSLRGSPFSNMEQWPSPGGPHQPGAMLRAGRWAAGCLGVVKGGSRAVLSNPSCSPATRLMQLRGQDLLCCYFFRGPGQGWLWGGGTLAADGCTPLALVSPAFEPPFPC